MKIAIIGAGAAGCFAAANIVYKNGNEVAVFEKNGKAMQKVKVSGGGRCNVTNSCFDVKELLNNYPRGKVLLRKILYQFGPRETIEWFRERNVSLKTEPDGRVFPVSDDSQTIIDCIWQEMMAQKVAVYFHKCISKVIREDNKFILQFDDKTKYIADKILVAIGGLPKPEQYNWIKDLGHTIREPVPSLFTFKLNNNKITELSGISIQDITLKITGTKIVVHGPILITHWGFSGPVVLKASAFAARELADKNYDFKVIINWLNDVLDNDIKITINQLRKKHGKEFLIHKNPFSLPRRLWEYLLSQCCITKDIRWGDLTATAQNKLIASLLCSEYEIKGKTTFKEEFVTCGGITLSEIDPETMQSKLLKGLFFAGELIDVDGITGGYNFQNAWSGGWVAAKNILL